MKILFVNLSPLKFNAATPDTEPLGGTESCICYLSRQLAANGHDITLMTRLPEGFSGIAHGVRHQPVAAIKDKGFFDAEKFDIIISCNAPVACPHLREISPQSKLLLWDHVLPEQAPMAELANPAVQQALDLIIYVSGWQRQATEKHFSIAKASRVVGNGFAPVFENMFSSPEEILESKRNGAAYTATPYRGLSILLKAMEGLKADMKLDVFSSMRVYQTGDEAHEGLFREAAKDSRITLHGSIPQRELAQKLKSAAFLTYPSVFQETFCIAALEAMAAGMKVIATRLGALETTTMGYADLVGVSSAEEIIPAYRAAIERNVAAFLARPEEWAAAMFAQVQAVNRACSWKVRSREWEQIFLETAPRVS